MLTTAEDIKRHQNRNGGRPTHIAQADILDYTCRGSKHRVELCRVDYALDLNISRNLRVVFPIFST